VLGVGVALPWIHAYMQGGDWLAPRGLALLPGFALLSLASAIASGLADERSDRAGGKRTVVSVLGNEPARRLIELASFAGASAWALTGMLTARIPHWLGVAPALVAFWYAGGLVPISGSAVTDAFEAQRRYKSQLHRAIWRGALVAAMLLAWLHQVLDV
jgi:1,4-dihydroxy-2-naphthoate octaprenyltransferase/chlorophyll synthase